MFGHHHHFTLESVWYHVITERCACGKRKTWYYFK